MVIRGWWGLLTVLFYPILAIQLIVPFWPDLFIALARPFGPDPFPVYLNLMLFSRGALVLIVATGIARALVAAYGIHARHTRVKAFFRTTEISKNVIEDRLTALQQYKLPLVVYGDPVPRAFVLGIFTTRIYLSTGLLSSPLTDLELGSVVMHEVHHHRMRDPLKGFVLSILTHLFFYLPVLRSYAEFWQQHREWEADAAAKRVSDATSLAEALCKLLSKSPHISGENGGGFVITSRQSAAAPALHGMGNIRERIELLLDLKTPRTWHLSAKELVVSSASMLLLAILTLGLVSPVDMTPGIGSTAKVEDASGWVVPQRIDDFWVPPFQGDMQRVRYIGIDPETAPPTSRHRVTR